MVIHRGELPGDHFTLVPNRWLRDPELSYRAKGLLAYIASHQVGYQLGTEQIIRESRDGRDAVYATLRELEDRGYLVRIQGRGGEPTGRGGTGRFGAVDYRIVDKPAGQTAYGKAVSGKTVNGSAVNGKPDTKKTRVKKTTGEKTTHPPAAPPQPQEPPPPPPAPGGRGEPQPQEQTPPDPDAEGLVGAIPALAGLPATARRRLAGRVHRCLAAGHPAPVVVAELTGSLAGAADPVAVMMTRLGDLATAPPQRAAPDVPRRPDHCGTCHEPTRMRSTAQDRQPYPCPQCHPDPRRRAAGAAAAAVWGGAGPAG